MDGNVGMAIAMYVLGVGLIIADSIFALRRDTSIYKEREPRIAADRHVYHVSVKRIDKLTNPSFVDADDKPPGLWYTFTKNGWIDYYGTKQYKYLYTLRVSSSAKLYTIDSVEKAATLCKEIVVGKTAHGQDIVDWKVVRSKYDGVEIKDGVVEKLKIAIKTPEYKVTGFSCMKIFALFDVESGCIWNLNKVSIASCQAIK